MGATAFYPGQILTRTDLNIFLTNSQGQRQDAYDITYAIYDNTTESELLIGSATRQPEHPEVGEYYAYFAVPDFAPYGNYLIRWTFKQSAGGSDILVVQEFAIVPAESTTNANSNRSDKELDLLRSLRIMLRDNNPDRNYRFKPPTSQDSLHKQTKVFGYIWEDEELLEALQRGLDKTNLYPPESYHTIQSLPRNWYTIVLTAAAVHALTALTTNWIAEEFGYSIGGVSLDLDKSSKYESLASAMEDRFNTMLEAAHRTLKVSKGLRQSKYNIGVRLGPYSGYGIMSARNFTW